MACGAGAGRRRHGAAVRLRAGRGADGDLTDDWPALRVPQLFAPATDACLPRIIPVVQARTYEAVDCARNHLAETVHVGTFVGPDGGPRPEPGSVAGAAHRPRRVRPARPGGARRRLAHRPADAHPRAALRPRRSGGARWFRCDLSKTGSIDNTRPVNRTGSLRGALIGDSPLMHRCFDPD